MSRKTAPKKIAPKSSPATTAEEQAILRRRIMDADPTEFLIRAMQGHPLPILSPPDADGNVEIMGYERVDVAARLAAADRLLRRISPELSSVSLEGNGEGGAVQFVVKVPEGVALPGSQRAAAPAQIEAPYEAQEFVNGLASLAARAGNHHDKET